MADLSAIKTEINTDIVTNGTGDITADVLNNVLNDLCDAVEADVQSVEDDLSDSYKYISPYFGENYDFGHTLEKATAVKRAIKKIIMHDTSYASAKLILRAFGASNSTDFIWYINDSTSVADNVRPDITTTMIDRFFGKIADYSGVVTLTGINGRFSIIVDMDVIADTGAYIGSSATLCYNNAAINGVDVDFEVLENDIDTNANDIDTLEASMATATSAISTLNDKMSKVGSVNGANDAIFNEFGTLSLPSDADKFFKVTSINGVLYNGTKNMADLLQLPSGSVTAQGVTVTIDGNHVTLSGTAGGGGFICFNDLTLYNDGAAAAAAVTFPSLPAIDYKFSIIKVSGSYGNLYYRKTNNSWGPLLTQNATSATIASTDVSLLGACGLYLTSGKVYDLEYYVGVFFSTDSATEVNSINNAEASTEEITTKGYYSGYRTWLYSGTATAKEVVPTTFKAVTEGKTIAWFGDSLSFIKYLPDLVGKKSAQTIYDCSFSGAPITYSSNYYQDTGFMSLASQIVAADFTPLTTAINLQYTDGLITEAQKDAKLANAATLAGLDFSSIDKVVIFSGTNEMSYSAATIANIKSGLTSALQALMAAYPNLCIYGILPPYRSDALTEQSNGLTLPEINDAIAEVYTDFNIPFIDFYHMSGVNAYNYTHWLSDGLHQTDEGDAMWSDKLAQWLLSI